MNREPGDLPHVIIKTLDDGKVLGRVSAWGLFLYREEIISLHICEVANEPGTESLH
jgi:hypothetical protein